MTIELTTDKMRAEIVDGVGWMTFDNPARHNAMSMEMNRAIPTIIETFSRDPAVRVVVMRGAGGRAFVSGADISEFGERRTSVDARKEYDAVAGAAQNALARLELPLIAMIEGFCMGGGVLTALKADIRIAADNAQFAVPAARLGLGYHYGGVEALVQLVGAAAAAEILYTARRYSADEAFHIGLVNRVVAATDLESVVADLADSIAGNAPMTIRSIKAAIREVGKVPDRRDLERVAELTEACFRSEDYLEGQAAFLEKRPPVFRGR
jgi:enoyl-CoA hydratase